MPATKSPLDFAKAAKSTADLVKVLRLPQNVHAPVFSSAPTKFANVRTAPATKSERQRNKLLHLPRNVQLSSPKRCACHAKLPLRKVCRSGPMGPGARPFRTRPTPLPHPSFTRPSPSSVRGSFQPAGNAKTCRGSLFSRFLFSRHARAHVFAHAFILSSSYLYARLVFAVAQCLYYRSSFGHLRG